jgi:hypothetical protein
MPPTTPPMTFLFESVRPLPLLLLPFCTSGGSVYVDCPVVMGIEFTPVDTMSVGTPLLSVVLMVVVKGWRDVETRALVLTMGVVRSVEEGASLEGAGALPPALERGVVAGGWLEAGAGACEDCCGGGVVAGSVGAVVGSVVGSAGLLVGAGVAGGAVEDGGAADVGELLLLLPVPEAWRFSPWCR